MADSVPLSPVTTPELPEEKFREFLEIRGEKLTEPRRILVRHIFDTHKHFDADELLEALKQAGRRVSRATVYRTLDLLVDAGLLRQLDVGPRKYYEHDYGYPQHEHLQCGRCGKMIEFQSPAIESAMREVCRQHHFHATGHTFVIRGTCAECNRARTTKRLLDLV